jgi:gamma-glutamyltranspeptidase/glutathione hydrolase
MLISSEEKNEVSAIDYREMAPSIRLAEEGFIVTPRFSTGLKSREKMLKKWESSAQLFYKADGSFYEPGELFVQKDLARTLRRIDEQGRRTPVLHVL